MKKKNLKFIIGILIIIIAAGWFGISGFKEGYSYYLTADELDAKKDELYNKRIKLAGKVVAGTISKSAEGITFSIEQNGIVIPVKYPPNEPVPDMFKDNIQVVISGMYLESGVFKSDFIQAKCPSKYEALSE